MSDEDWVARLLQDADSPAMPDDVAARLERSVRHEVEAQGRVAATAEDPPVPRLHQVHPEPDATTVSGPGPDDAPEAAPGPDPDRAAAGAPEPSDSVLAGPRGGSSRRELRKEDAAERRRRTLSRLAPVAAGLLVLGGAGAVAVSTLGGGDDSADTASLEAAGGAEDTSVPRALVATGTEYTTTDDEVFAEQVRDLVAVAGSNGDTAALSAPATPEAEAAEAEAAGTDAGATGGAADDEQSPAPAEARSAVAGPLTDRETFDECIEAVTEVGSTPVTAVDLAVVDGLESTVVVVPDPSGENLFVYVVGPDCSDVDGPGFKFREVEP